VPDTRLRFQQPRRLYAKIFILENPGKADLAISTHRDADPVCAVDEAKHRLQIVVAVGPTAEDVEKEVELGRRGVPGQFHCVTARRRSMRW
jgi:hypothetical protein